MMAVAELSAFGEAKVILKVMSGIGQIPTCSLSS